MRTLACIVSTVLVSLASLVAHTDQAGSEQVTRDAIARCATSPCILNAPLANAPFSAEATTVWQPPARSTHAMLRTTARYYRDSAARVRVDQRVADNDVRVLLAPEAGSRAAYVLDPAARTVSTPVPRGLTQMMIGNGGYHYYVLPRSMKRFLTFFLFPNDAGSASTTDEESLGERSIAGLRVTGTRVVTWLPGLLGNGRAERWVSPELGLVVYSRSEDAHFGTFEYQLTDIDRSDPPSDLFEVPRNYTETPFEYAGLTWDGPNTPTLRNTK